MPTALPADDLRDIATLAVLNAHRATMLHGEPWKALLEQHGLADDAAYAALSARLATRFAKEPLLARTFAERYQQESQQLFAQAARAKEIPTDAQGAASQWNQAFDIDDDKAKAFASQYVSHDQDPAPPGYTPNLELVAAALKTGSDRDIQALLSDRATVFHVDWREGLLDIVGLVGDRVPDGVLTIAALSDEELTLASGERTEVVVFSDSPADRNAILRASDRVLRPEYELRLCLDTQATDTLGFLCLSAAAWAELEEAHPSAVATRFRALDDAPLFD